ncbi:MAG: hypothetical protein AAB227_02595 [Pseudomonadota bacterium]
MRGTLGKASRKERRNTGLSPLTTIVIGVGAIIWFAQIVPTLIYSDCQSAAYWLSGYFKFTSLYQWTGLAIGALLALWAASLFLREARGGVAEAVMQGVVLAALALWFISLKAYLFPFAFPGAASYASVMDRLHPMPVMLESELGLRSFWVEGLPQLEVEFDQNPMRNPAIAKRLPEIFTSAYSPTAADFERLDRCVAEQHRALAQYRKDNEAIDDYRRRADLALRPTRPRDWREEAAEMAEAEGD